MRRGLRSAIAPVLLAGGLGLLGGPVRANGPCIDHFDFQNCPLGQAVLDADSQGHLVVSNIGSSGDDGVIMRGGPLGAVMGGLGALPVLPPTRALDAYLEIKGHGRVDVSPDEQVLGSSRVTYVDEAVPPTLQVTADFAPIGATTRTIEVYDEGVLVHTSAGHTGPIAETTTPPVAVLARIDAASPELFLVWGWPTNTPLRILGGPVGTPVLGDELRIVPESPTATVQSITAAAIYGADLGSFTIADEACRLADGSAVIYGLHHVPRSSPLLQLATHWDATASRGRLALLATYPGLSQDEAVTVDHADDDLPSFGVMTNVDAYGTTTRTSPAVTLTPIGTLPGPRGPRVNAVGYVKITVDHEGWIEVLGNFDPLGASTMRVEVYDRGALVHAAGGHSGTAARIPPGQVDLVMGEQVMIQPPTFHVATRAPVVLDLVGGGTATGDEVRLVAESPAVLPEDRTAVDWQVEDIAFTKWIDGGVGPVPADVDGDHLVNVTDLLAVLGTWGPCPLPCPPACPADVNGDCAVNVNDLLMVLAHWS
ncbi:MAG: hypothetical protein ACYTG1_05400 [Planctomycetota bacterium]|jgi:hypothetical protein